MSGAAADVRWQDLPAAELERHFNPRAAVPDFEAYGPVRVAASAAVRARLRDSALDLRYGPNPLETLDVFRPDGAGAPAPVQLYIHGGYWRAMDKNDFSFVAGPIVDAGGVAVVMNYDLCPNVTLDEIVREVRRCVVWTWRNVARYGGDPARLHLSGSSAGGHLVAMALAHDWTQDGLPADVIRGAVPITGIYDIAPVLGISVNAEIRLDAEMARRNSPMFMPLLSRAPALVAVGGGETPGWIRQSRDYAAHRRSAGLATEYMELPDDNHLSITARLGNADDPLTRGLLRQMGLAD